MPTPMTLVLFGATGDLARSKLWPALHDLAASGRLPEELAVLGVSRSSSTEELRELAAEHGPGGARLESGERWKQLLEATEVVNGAADDPELYERLRAGARRARGRPPHLPLRRAVAVRRDRRRSWPGSGSAARPAPPRAW